MALNKVRLICHGQPWNLQLTDAETGEPLNCVSKVEYISDISEHFLRLTIPAIFVDIDVVAEAEIQTRIIEHEHKRKREEEL